MSYEVVAEEEPNEECHGMGHGAMHSSLYINALPISPHHFVYSSCSGSEWVDFKLALSADDFGEALRRTAPSVAAEELRSFARWDEEFGCKEAS